MPLEKEELKKLFATGKKPTGAHFSALIDGVEGPKGEPGIDGINGNDGLGYEEVSEEFKKVTEQLAEKATPIDIMLSGTRQAYAAHRGFSLIAPENTIPAYEMASKHGFLFAETDLQSTADGEIVLMHDLTVDRTTNGVGVVGNLTSAQIQALTIDVGHNIESHPNLKVPTLDEFLNTMIETGMIPLMEMKTFDFMEKLIQAVKDKGLENKSIVMISKEMMPAFRVLSKKITLAMLTDDIGNIPYLVGIGNTMMIMHYASVTPEKVIIAHKSGIPVANWGSYNYQHLQSMFEAKVDINITDGTMLGGRH